MQRNKRVFIKETLHTIQKQQQNQHQQQQQQKQQQQQLSFQQ